MRAATVQLLALMAALAVACDPTPIAHPPHANTPSGGERNTPVTDDPATVAEGRRLFEAACARCHGPNAETDGGVLRDLALDPERMNTALHAGSDDGGVMPTVSPSVMTERDLPALRAYLRSIRALR